MPLFTNNVTVFNKLTKSKGHFYITTTATITSL